MKQIRLPAHLHRQAKDYAKRTRMKLEGVIELAVANGLKVLMDRYPTRGETRNHHGYGFPPESWRDSR